MTNTLVYIRSSQSLSLHIEGALSRLRNKSSPKSQESKLRREGFVLAAVVGLFSGSRGAIGPDDGGNS